MAIRYLNEFHKRNCQACRRDLKSSAKQPLSVEDVLRQSRSLGSSSIMMISQGTAAFKSA